MFLSLDISPATAIRSRIRPFLLEGRGSIPAATGAAVIVCSTQVLPNYNAYILAYGVSVRDTPEYQYTGSLAFSLYVNGGPYLDNNSNASWTLQRGTVDHPIPTLIQTQSGGIIQFLCQRVVATAQASTVDFIALGWQIPADVEPTKNCNY